MPFIKHKVKLGPGYGVTISENGLSGFFKTPLGTYSPQATALKTSLPGVKFTPGSGGGGGVLLGFIRVVTNNLNRASGHTKPFAKSKSKSRALT